MALQGAAGQELGARSGGCRPRTGARSAPWGGAGETRFPLLLPLNGQNQPEGREGAQLMWPGGHLPFFQGQEQDRGWVLGAAEKVRAQQKDRRGRGLSDGNPDKERGR